MKIMINRDKKTIAFVEGSLEKAVAYFNGKSNSGFVSSLSKLGDTKDYKRYSAWKKAVENYLGRTIDWNRIESKL